MKVKYIPCQPHCFSFGGFDLQMIHTLEAVNRAGVIAERLNPWDRDNNFEILHLWGFDISHYRSINFSKREGKKILLTALTGYTSNHVEGLKWKIRNLMRSYSYHKEMIRLIDSFVVLNEGQAEFACKYWQIPESKINIIPIIVHDNYFKTHDADNSFYNLYGVKDFVLTTGNVGLRKNQLKLAEACMLINKNLVIIGKPMPGEDEYANKLHSLINKSSCITWINEVQNNSSILVSAYSQCDFFALLSRDEQQPTSAVEAAVMNKPILLADKAYAKQQYFKGAYLTDCEDVQGIINALKIIDMSPESYKIPSKYLNIFSAEKVGQEYVNIYRKLL